MEKFSQRKITKNFTAEKHALLTPENSVVTLVDHQPPMFFGVYSHEWLSNVNDAVARSLESGETRRRRRHRRSSDERRDSRR